MSDRNQSWTSTLETHLASLMQWAAVQIPGWVRSKVDPADLVQQTLLEVLREAARLEGRSALEVLSFLRRALTNNLIDAARKFQRSRDDVSPEALAESSLRLAEWLAADQTSPSECAVRNERFAGLAAALTRLPDAQRVAVEMRYLQGAKVVEIARVLGRSEGAVSLLLHRAVTTLREELRDFVA